MVWNRSEDIRPNAMVLCYPVITADEYAHKGSITSAMARALSAEKIPFELHIMPEGPHGMSTCTKEVGTEDAYVGRWVEWSIAWLAKTFGFAK